MNKKYKNFRRKQKNETNNEKTTAFSRTLQHYRTEC